MIRLSGCALLGLFGLLIAGSGCGAGIESTGSSPASEPEAAAGTPSAGGPAVIEVTIEAFAFLPSDLNVPVGTTVRFVNHDATPHNVVFPDTIGPDLYEGESWSHAFDEEGVYRYFCEFHHGMEGRVTVSASL